MIKPDYASLPVVEVFVEETTRLNINLLYSFMLKRISKGYSSLDVSFLMGYSYDFIKSVEELMHLGLDFITTNLYLRALQDSDNEGILFNDFESKGVETFKLVRTTRSEQIIHEVFRVFNEDDSEVIFRLFENNHRSQAQKNEHGQEEKRMFLTKFLDFLFSSTYFLSPREPNSIFQRCRVAVDGELKPYEVREILFEMCKQKSYPKLKAKDRKDGLTFEKVFRIGNKSM